MTPLRQRMIEDMQLRQLAPATQRNYILHLTRFAKYYGQSPERLDLEDIRQFHPGNCAKAIPLPCFGFWPYSGPTDPT